MLTLSRLRFALLAVLCALPVWADSTFAPTSKVPPELIGKSSDKARFFQRLSFSEPGLRPLHGGKFRLVMPGARYLLVPGMPALPILVRQLPAVGDGDVRAELRNLSIQESSTALPLPQIDPALVWNQLRPAPPMRVGPDPDSRYFPGKFLISSRHDDHLSVTVFPVQYDRLTRHLVVLRSADLFVSEQARPVVQSEVQSPETPSLILTSEKTLAAAQLLQQFQERALSVPSRIVTVEAIDRTEVSLDENELPAGYRNSPGTRSNTVIPYDPNTGNGYNYELARKIAHFLQQFMRPESITRYITLLGNDKDIPPSYYYSTSVVGYLAVTDECYGASHQCLDPWLAVGRLPFDSVDEVSNYLSKVGRWLTYSASSPSEVALYGGKAFPAEIYTAELGTLKLINTPQDNWRGVEKYFSTRGTFNKATVSDMADGRSDSSFVYYLDHGGGNVLAIEDEQISSKEVLGATDSGPVVNPVVVSVACTAAAFDSDLLNLDVFSGAEFGSVSVGVAMMRSKAGAVAYLGSTRPATGQPVYDIDSHGNLELVGTNYGLELQDTFFQKYEAARGGALGDSLLAAQKAYAYDLGNDMTQSANQYAFFNQELLGDPTLPLPSRKVVAPNYGFPESTTVFPPQTGPVVPHGMPRFELPQHSPLKLAFVAGTPLEATFFRMTDVFFDPMQTRIDQQRFEGGNQLSETLTPDSAGIYFLRLENTTGVPMERQVWFQIAR